MQVYKFDLFDPHPSLSVTIQFWSDPIILGVLNWLTGIQYPPLGNDVSNFSRKL